MASAFGTSIPGDGLSESSSARLALVVDNWSRDASQSAEIMVRLEDDTVEVNMSNTFPLRFVIPKHYVEVQSSRPRWRHWHNIIDDPSGFGIFPAHVTETQCRALRGLARVLLHFSVPGTAHDQQTWGELLAVVHEMAEARELTGEQKLMNVVEWVRNKYAVGIISQDMR
ncbi:hypothetical protein OH77DRAFT_1540943 [Trametes cingulata]|nr:hypothetical protein OH77DRAFT_1540943 [Trametes cingulata]